MDSNRLQLICAIEGMVSAAADANLTDDQALTLLQEARDNCVIAFGECSDEQFRKIVYRQLATVFEGMLSSIAHTPATKYGPEAYCGYAE